MMQIHRVLLIITIYLETILPASITTKTIKKSSAQLIQQSNNTQAILTKKGRKIQMTKDGDFVICGIDSLEDDYYGCQSSNEMYINEFSKNKSKATILNTTTSVKDIKVEKKEKMEVNSTATATTSETATTISMDYHSNTGTSNLQMGLLSPRASDDQVDDVKPNVTATISTTASSTARLSKKTRSSTTPMFASSRGAGTGTGGDTSTSTTSAADYIIGNLFLFTSQRIRPSTEPRSTLTPEFYKQEDSEMEHHPSGPPVATGSVVWYTDTQPVVKHLFYYY